MRRVQKRVVLLEVCRKLVKLSRDVVEGVVEVDTAFYLSVKAVLLSIWSVERTMA